MFVPGLVSYKGLKLIKNLHYECYLDTLKDFEIWDSDIFAVTYPKSGTRWMQYIIALLFHENSGLWLNALTPIICLSPSLQSTASRSKKEREGKIKMIVVYIGRNPKDVACSFYHFHNVNRLLEDKEDFNTFLEEFLEGKGGYVCPIAQKENFDILFLTYEEMKKDMKGVIEQFSITQSERFDTIYKEGMKGFPLDALTDKFIWVSNKKSA
uniref:Sulfotransferase n=1 Tax=Oncorhynchus tshawytscha TaxID=74940 RepID=A0A8C8BSL5_ONCTS